MSSNVRQTTPDSILVASTILTMDDAKPRVKAVAVSGGRIVATGTRAECEAALPGATVTDLGDSVLMPGFIDPHGHVLLSGMLTETPAYNISPWMVPTWDDIVALGKKAAAETPPDHAILMFGLDRLLHGVNFPRAAEMDAIFGDRLAAIVALSQHQTAITTHTMRQLGWIDNPPPDPTGATFERNPDGSLTGLATEVPACMLMLAPIVPAMHGNPITQAALYTVEMAKVGVTAASEIGYVDKLQPGYEALVALPHSPLRYMVYQQTVEPTAADPLKTSASPDWLRKNGVKLWADGSPWLGSISSSYPFLDSEATRAAGFTNLNPGMTAMNYTIDELDDLIDRFATTGWQIACHINGDLGMDLVLDAMERALKKHGLLGTDHRWRLEHVGAAEPRHYERMAELGVVPTIGIFQMMQWGDLLDGQLFHPDKGARWSACADARAAGCRFSFHNDGNISRPNPLASVRAAVTRKSNSGKVHGPEQAVPLDDALKAITIDAAYIMKMDDRAGSIVPGKYADFVQLSADPHSVAPDDLLEKVVVEATWVDGRRVDLDAFVAAASAVEVPTAHEIRAAAPAGCGCNTMRGHVKGHVSHHLAGKSRA